MLCAKNRLVSHIASERATPTATAPNLTGSARALRNAQVMEAAVVAKGVVTTIELTTDMREDRRCSEMIELALLCVRDRESFSCAVCAVI